MIRAALLLLALSGCSSLPREQFAYEAAYQMLHVADTLQTLDIKNHAYLHETNPILGRNPSDGEIIAYMAAEAVGHAYVTSLLVKYDAPMWAQRAWHMASIGWNGQLVIRNRKMGLGP